MMKMSCVLCCVYSTEWGIWAAKGNIHNAQRMLVSVGREGAMEAQKQGCGPLKSSPAMDRTSISTLLNCSFTFPQTSLSRHPQTSLQTCYFDPVNRTINHRRLV